MKVRAKNRIKRNHEHILAGSVFELPNKEAKDLMKAGVVEPAAEEAEEKPQEPPAKKKKKLEGEAREEAINELCDVKFVTEEIAGTLIDELDIVSIDGLKKAKVAQLVGIKGVGEETAEKIIADAKEFED